MANEHLLKVKEGEEFKLQLNFDDYEPPGPRSGHVPPGNYEMKIAQIDATDKSGGKTGKNVRLVCTVTAPAQFSGTSVVQYHAAPVAKGDEFKKAQRTFCSIIRSYKSTEGMEAVREYMKGSKNMPFTKLVGRTIFAQLKDEVYQGNKRSSIAWYIVKPEFEAAPGPQASMASDDDELGDDDLGDDDLGDVTPESDAAAESAVDEALEDL